MSLGVLVCFGVALVSSVQVYALRSSSTNYVLEGNTAGTFGGASSSGSYGLFASGGESIVGEGAGGSYMYGAGFVSQLENSIQVAVQPSGLVRHFTLDEPSGSEVRDASAFSSAGTIQGSEIQRVPGKLGGGLEKPPGDPYAWTDPNARITAPISQVAAVTVSVWVKPQHLSGWSNIVGYSANSSYAWGPWELYTDGSGGSGFQWSVHTAGGLQRLTAASPGVGQWQLVTATYDSASGQSRLYINGSLAANATYASGAINYSTGNPQQQVALFNSLRSPDEGFRGAIDHVKIFDRVLTDVEVSAEYQAQNQGHGTGLGLGVVTPGASRSVTHDIIVRTDSSSYGIAVAQNHGMQQGGFTIPAIGGSITTPSTWNEGVTKGLGFTLTSAPQLAAKWGAGANYAAFPDTAATFYTRSSHAGIDVVDVIKGRVRLDTTQQQRSGTYENTVTYTGTLVP